ncbi:hypothetical protein KRB39_005001 [Salmonella enterica]|nr:hypothetical protein [Salmonella enterica]EDS0414464.1 hypothetical protein [Salmonella enterica subsp. enterica serovar Apapa]EDU3707828.1 hypothetical protein [Salmonella enterica subsp. enterica]EDW2469703.1 hypothetical protein [Salmonella enterica subsp. enterica serovar Vitkin]EDX4962209.1 hypothetical protein [Salmonella enterica subsp. salamae serovar 58:l,z13,z28:z6]EEF0891255.1 hypothetical protein [Salmonella enterica subsp. enterica serovar Senftenberg]EHG3420131.1 hypothetical
MESDIAKGKNLTNGESTKPAFGCPDQKGSTAPFILPRRFLDFTVLTAMMILTVGDKR